MNLAQVKEAGIEYEAGLQRLSGNRDLYDRFLVRFFSDPTFNELNNSIAEKRYEEAYKQAKILEGLTKNLSMVDLCEPISEIVIKLEREELDKLPLFLKTANEKYLIAKSAVGL